MKRKSFNKKGPEEKIRDRIIPFLKDRGWFVKIVHGNKFTSGLPVLYIAHKSHGPRWVELKNPLSYHFTPAQKKTFPEMTAAGVGIWILTDATNVEYEKLWKPPNWYIYYGRSKKPF